MRPNVAAREALHRLTRDLVPQSDLADHRAAQHVEHCLEQQAADAVMREGPPPLLGGGPSRPSISSRSDGREDHANREQAVAPATSRRPDTNPAISR